MLTYVLNTILSHGIIYYHMTLFYYHMTFRIILHCHMTLYLLSHDNVYNITLSHDIHIVGGLYPRCRRLLQKQA